MLFAPTCAATSSSARHTLRCSGVRSHAVLASMRPVAQDPVSVSNRRAGQRACVRTLLAGLAPLFFLRVGAQLATREDAPRCECETEGARHGDDVAFEGAVEDAPLALVHDEGRLAVVLGVLVGLGDDPGGGVGDALKTVTVNKYDFET